MKILSVSKGLKLKTYKFKLTEEEFARLDILAKDAGVTKDEYLQITINNLWKATRNEGDLLDAFRYAFEECLRKGVVSNE